MRWWIVGPVPNQIKKSYVKPALKMLAYLESSRNNVGLVLVTDNIKLELQLLLLVHWD